GPQALERAQSASSELEVDQRDVVDRLRADRGIDLDAVDRTGGRAPIRSERLEPVAASMMDIAQAQPGLRVRRPALEQALVQRDRLVESARAIRVLGIRLQRREFG